MTKRNHRKKRHLKRWVKYVLLFLIGIPCFLFGRDVYLHYFPFLSITCIEKPDVVVRYDGVQNQFLDDKNKVLTDLNFQVEMHDKEKHKMKVDSNGMIIQGLASDESGYYLYDESGFLVTKSQEWNGTFYKIHKDGKLYHQEWSGKNWYEKGVSIGKKEDTLVFVAGETGFYYLSAKDNGEKKINSSANLEDGREVRFDENGHIVTNEVYTENMYYFPVCEAEEKAGETYSIPVKLYIKEKSQDGIRLINHRGYHVNAPENTLAAYQESKKNQYNFVETDVQMTSDNIPVLLHNQTLGAMAGVNVAINSITEKEAEEYLLQGEKITTLDEFIAYCKANLIVPYIELKTETITCLEQIEMIYDVVKKYDMCKKVEWISFSPDLLEMLGNIDNSVPFGFVVGSKSDEESVMNRALEMKNNGMNVFIDAKYHLQDVYLSFCKENDIPMELWGINTMSELDHIDSYVTGVTTDIITN